jgi:galactokinase
MDFKKKLVDGFHACFHSDPEFLVRAPGRINLIGEHTDYNDGFVLPLAINRAVWLALRNRQDRMVVVYSLDFAEKVEFSLDDIRRDRGWSENIKGIAWAFQDAGYHLNGWEGIMAGDVPIGAGLSSSAAAGLVTARAFTELSGLEWNLVRMAKICQAAENQWLGLNSGIMDQMVSAGARLGHAFFLDCRSLEFQHVPIPPGIAILVLDTMTRRELVNSAYNQRRAECVAAARFFGVPALRDVTLDMLVRKSALLDNVLFRRTHHVVTENQRVLDAVAALRLGDTPRLGELLKASHVSLRDDFEVSSDTLDQIVACANQQSECYGARMTGGGFGGCALALVRADSTETFIRAVRRCYLRASGFDADIYVCSPGEGAGVFPL